MIRRGYVDTVDGQIHYRYCEGGKGPPLVFFHMTASSSIAYENMLNLLEGKYPLFALDTPHYGQSFVPKKEPSIAYIAAVVLEALSNLGVDRFHAFGHHTGTNISAELAALAPQRVLSVSMNGMTYTTNEENALFYKTLVFDNPINTRGAQLIWAWTRVMCDTDSIPVPADLAHREVIDTLIAGEQWHWGYRAVFTHDIMSTMAKVRCPMFLICGQHDLSYPFHERTKQAFPDATVHEHEDFGTYYIISGAAQAAPALVGFIDAVNGKSAAR